jgi:hypothetical protein
MLIIIIIIIRVRLYCKHLLVSHFPISLHILLYHFCFAACTRNRYRHV